LWEKNEKSQKPRGMTMEKKQIIICFDSGRWMTDFLQVPEGKSPEEALGKYTECYEAVREHNLPLLSRLLPTIIYIFLSGE
jgi:hypothetical protein